MSTETKQKLKRHATDPAVWLLIIILGGVVDLRRCFEVFRQLPEMKTTQEEHGREIRKLHDSINEVKDALKRNKIAAADPNRTEITTANYQ